MDLHKIKRLLADTVLVEVEAEEQTKGGIIIPLEATSRYPESGRVVATGPKCVEGLKAGDLVVLVDEGISTGYTYWQVCFLKLKDWEPIEHVDIEVWPTLYEAIEDYRRNPSTNEKSITVKTIDSTTLNFLTSDVLEYGLTELGNKDMDLEYVAVRMLWFWRDGLSRLFYFIPERDILATVEY